MKSKEKSWMVLNNNRLWRVFEPKPYDISPEMLILAMARVPRYGGHYDRNVKHYSIAEHACLCYAMLLQRWPKPEPDLQMAVLLHDAHEVITGFGDVCGNMKHLCPELKKLENDMDCCIAERLGFDPQLFDHAAVKDVDALALHVEHSRIMPVCNAPWPECNEDYNPPWMLGMPSEHAEVMMSYTYRLIQAQREMETA